MSGFASPSLLGVCTITLISRAPGNDLPDFAIALGSEVPDEFKKNQDIYGEYDVVIYSLFIMLYWHYDIYCKRKINDFHVLILRELYSVATRLPSLLSTSQQEANRYKANDVWPHHLFVTIRTSVLRPAKCYHNNWFCDN